MTAVDLAHVQRRANRILHARSVEDVVWLLPAGRHLATQALALVTETAVLRGLVDDLEARLAVVEAERDAAVEASERRLATVHDLHRVNGGLVSALRGVAEFAEGVLGG